MSRGFFSEAYRVLKRGGVFCVHHGKLYVPETRGNQEVSLFSDGIPTPLS